jgi:hypothetical protein
MKSIADILKSAQENNEPVFVIRAKDKCALAAIGAYNVTSHIAGVNDEHLKETQQIFRDFVKWQGENKDKVNLPD